MVSDPIGNICLFAQMCISGLGVVNSINFCERFVISIQYIIIYQGNPRGFSYGITILLVSNEWVILIQKRNAPHKQLPPVSHA